MPGPTERIMRKFDTRMDLRRRMMLHAGIRDQPEVPRQMKAILRETLLTCAACPNARSCHDWLEEGQEGVPDYCAARWDFMRLRAIQSDLAELV